MCDIWFCEYLGDITTDNYSLSYLKKIYENIKKDEVKQYVNNYIVNYCKALVGENFGCDNQCTKIVGLGIKNNYCLFIEELESE